MECRACGAKDKFQVVVTDYKPMEVWEFAGGELSRFAQPDSGDMDIEISCLKCGSADVDKQGFDIESYATKKLTSLSDEAWDEKVKA